MKMNNPNYLSLYQKAVPEAWIDYNNHMTEGYYGVAFADASDAVLTYLGLQEYMLRTHCTFYTAENHLIFERELKLHDPIHVETLVVGADRKKFQLFHEMIHSEKGYRAATMETILLHVNQDLGGVVLMPDDFWLGLEKLVKEHAHLPRPKQLNRAIRQLPPLNLIE